LSEVNVARTATGVGYQDIR